MRMKVIWHGMAKPDDPIYKTGLTVSAKNSKPSTQPSPPSTDGTKTPSLSQNQDKKQVKPISLRSKAPEEYRTQGGWQMGTVHTAASSQTARDSSEPETKTVRGKKPRK